MAIVENRSTEIGDVIRIRTDVPIAGIISLTSFIDDTEGENIGADTASSFPPFEQGTRVTVGTIFTAQSGNIRYSVTQSVDGSNRQNAIVSLDVSTGIWDLDYPDDPLDFIRRLILISNNLYATHYNSAVTNSFAISRLDLTTRTWSVISQGEVGDDYSFTVEGSINNNIYFFRRALTDGATIIRAFPELVEYDITADTYTVITAFPLASGIPNPARNRVTQVSGVNDAVLDEINEKLYVSHSGRGGGDFQPNLYEYDFATDTWTSLASAAEQFHGISAHWNSDDGLIYAIKEDSPYNILTYDITTDTWTIDENEPPGLVQFLSSGNGLVYAEALSATILTYNPSDRSWTGGSNSRIFVKQFRYSIDGGLNFTPFMDLTAINVQSISVDQKDQFVIEASYERSGTDAGGELAFNSFTIGGNFDRLGTPIYDMTIFKGLFESDDVNVLGWALNVLEKIYQRGLLPDYIDRNREEKDDTDFVSYWYSITHLFAILVYWMRNFENIPSNRTLLTAFLRNFDITLPFDLNLADEATIYSQRTDEYRRRGTSRITVPATDPNEDVNGELLRLVDWVVNDFFLFALTESSRFGWCLGLSSPTWTSTTGVTNLVMGYEFTTSVEDLTSYPLVGSANIAIVADNDISQNVMAITSYAGVAGTYGIDTGASPTDNTFLIPVWDDLDYEISFKAKKLSTDALEINFRAYAYDVGLTNMNLIPINGSTANVNNFQLTAADEVVLVEDTYYTYTGILHASSTATTTGLTGRIEGYRGLRMPANTSYIGVGITVQGDANRSDFYLYDIKIRPKDLPISQCLLGVKNIIVSYIENRGELNDEVTRLFIQNRLIPYNSFLIPKWLSSE